MNDESKAVREIAKTSGKAIDVGRDMARFIGQIIGGPLEQAAGIWEDRLKYARTVNQLKLRDKFQRHLEERGLTEPTRPVPIPFAVPLLQSATLEDDDYLQEVWATMLANAADERADVQLRRAFISILEDMTSLDAQILKTVGDGEKASGRGALLWSGFHIGNLPERAEPVDEYRSEAMEPPKDVSLSVANLIRLGLLRNADNPDGYSNPHEVRLTDLGREFLRACSSDLRDVR